MPGTLRKTSLTLIGLALLALVIFWLAARARWNEEQRAAEEAGLAHVTVAMKWSFAGTMAPYFAAQRNGVFRDNHLDVELTEGGPGQPTSVQQVILEKADFGITGAHELAVARSQDQPLISLAVIFKMSPVCLLTTKDKRITSPQDLVGKTVEMTSGDNAEFEYLAMLRGAEVDPDSVHQIPWQYTYQRLLTGSSDAVVCYENDQAIVMKNEFETHGKEIDVLCPRKFEVTPYADVLFTSEDLVESNPALVGQVVEGFLAAWEWTNTHVEETARLYASAPQLTGREIDPAIQVAVLRKSLEFVKGEGEGVESGAHISGIGIQERERWAETVDLLRDYGNLEKLPEPESLFSNRWVRQHEMMREENETGDH